MQQLYDTNLDEFFAKQESQYKTDMANDFLITNYPDEQSVDEIRYEYSGNYLKWPESIHNKKIKIIVHHTASDFTSLLTGGKEKVIQYLNDVYKFHTFTRWWWDIWYHFLIDPFWNIYEGRAGWEWVVWAHVSRNNTPSLGISLMWNFEINQPTEKQMAALIKLTTALAKKYKINPYAKVDYFKEYTEAPYLQIFENYTIAWHKDAGKTACPGKNLYSKLSDIRQKVKSALKNYILTSSSSSIDNGSGGKTTTSAGTKIPWIYYIKKSDWLVSFDWDYDDIVSCKSESSWLVINDCLQRNGRIYLSLSRKSAATWLKTFKIKTTDWEKKISVLILRQQDLESVVTGLRDKYFKQKNIKKASSSMSKIAAKVTLQEAKKILEWNISVLLYDVSKNYDRREITCQNKCNLNIDGKLYVDDNFWIESHDGFLYVTLTSLENSLSPSKIELSSVTSGWLVTIKNYPRRSFAGIARNTFYGKLIFAIDKIKNASSWKFEEKIVVVNNLPLRKYLAGIAETYDAEPFEKQKVLMLISKMYAIFYMNAWNKHPSIPDGASYKAIDHPDFFQKYVWAWLEKTLKKTPIALAETMDQFVLYNWYVPILPYFSCSAGFTFSAVDKRWWTDTPYLKSRLDLEACEDFQWHGVWLSGKWATYFADNWRTMDQILKYYYDGIEIVN